MREKKKKKERETKTEGSTFGIPVTIGSTNADFGGDEFLCSMVAVTQLAIVSCGDAALLILSTGSSRSLYSESHQTA